MKIHQLNGNILANNTIVIKTRLVSTKYASDIFEISLITLSRAMTVLFGIVGYYGTTNSFIINSNINGNNNIEISAFQYDGYVYIAITNNNAIGYQYLIQSNNSVIKISDLTEIPTGVETKTITWQNPLAGVINPLTVADGNGIDFNKTKTFQNRIYHIGNINNQTTNPPISTSSSAIYVNIGNGNRVCEMLFGVEQSFIFSRYNGGDWKRVDNWGQPSFTLLKTLAATIASDINVDANDILETSFYSVGSVGTQYNLPDNYGILLCFGLPGKWYSAIQLFFTISSKAMYYRIKQSSWTEWYKVG